ncbi:MAG: alpha-D-ribose 1-methylphosphonate 5-triphosphate diphosphatase [Granulosicoccus sp.]|nr:alpha-D-ribose 1-methylphosphonate 5-triphosphate diphosphatase [Granulosicoccus sp.]
MNTRRQKLFVNARIVLTDEIVQGSVSVIDGKIESIDSESSYTAAADSTLVIDCEQDYLIPGLIELHTDHLENHYLPRPNVKWNMMSAVQAHDAQISAAGITTVYDCLRAGSASGDMFTADEMLQLGQCLKTASDKGRLRADHHIHLRCEVSAASMRDDFDRFSKSLDIALVSMMDHAPGQRQFTSLEAYAAYHQAKYQLSNEEFARFVEVRLADSERYSQPHRHYLSENCKAMNIPLASHDDATEEHVSESVNYGVCIAEFPTTSEAAKASSSAGLDILMGAPNVVRGASHSGNVSARSLLESHCLTVLSSDYVPSSLLSAVFLITQEFELMSLPAALQLVTKNPAQRLGLNDRGEISTGLRADLVRIALDQDQVCAPHVKAVWRCGERVM